MYPVNTVRYTVLEYKVCYTLYFTPTVKFLPSLKQNPDFVLL